MEEEGEDSGIVFEQCNTATSLGLPEAEGKDKSAREVKLQEISMKTDDQNGVVCGICEDCVPCQVNGQDGTRRKKKMPV
jgi:hypothetical protein